MAIFIACVDRRFSKVNRCRVRVGKRHALSRNTNGCPDCRRALPALELANRGLAVSREGSQCSPNVPTHFLDQGDINLRSQPWIPIAILTRPNWQPRQFDAYQKTNIGHGPSLMKK